MSDQLWSKEGTVPSKGASQMISPTYLLGCVAHVHCIINPVFQKAPSVLKVWGGVLHHHQLCCVVDASQHSSAGVPVKLHRNQRRKVGHHYCRGLGQVWGSSYAKLWALRGFRLVSSFLHRYLWPSVQQYCSGTWVGIRIIWEIKL